MAHNINFNERTGRYSFFSVQQKAWHGLGQIVEQYPTSEEAIRHAGLDYEVVKLERTRIMNVSLKGLPVGDWRDLTPKEMAVLLKSIEDSSSEDSTAAKKSRKAPRKKPRTDTSSKSKESSKPTGAAKGNAKHPKDGARKPTGTKDKNRRPFGDGKKSGGNGKPTANGRRPSKGRGSKR